MKSEIDRIEQMFRDSPDRMFTPLELLGLLHPGKGLSTQSGEYVRIVRELTRLRTVWKVIRLAKVSGRHRWYALAGAEKYASA